MTSRYGSSIAFSRLYSCGAREVLAVRNMSCRDAAIYYVGHDGSQIVPLSKEK